MLKARKHLQSETTTKSERVVQVSSKFAIHQLLNADGVKKVNPSEASHRVRVVQALGPGQISQKKTRELRWQNAVKALRIALPDIVAPNFITRNVTHFNPLEPGTFVITRNTAREYIGEVLDVYKKGASSRHGSVVAAPSVAGLSYLSLRVYLPMKVNNTCIIYDDFEDDVPATAPPFTCRERTFDLHTHASVNELVFNLGKKALSGNIENSPCILSPDATICWTSLTSPKILNQLPKLRIPGGRMTRKLDGRGL